MSNFGAKLAELLERRKMRAAELARVTNLNDSLVSKWINGQQIYVSNEDLAKLTGAISPIAQEQAELVKAHLLDAMVGPGSELIEILILGQTEGMRATGPKYGTPLPLKIQRAIDILGKEAVCDADVRNVLLSLANMISTSNSKTHSADQIASDALSAGVSELVDGSKTRPTPTVLPSAPVDGRPADGVHPSKPTKNL